MKPKVFAGSFTKSEEITASYNLGLRAFLPRKDNEKKKRKEKNHKKLKKENQNRRKAKKTDKLLHDLLQAHGSEVRELIAAVDKQGSGFISYDSFEAVMAHSMMQQAAGVRSAQLSSTVRLQPDSAALPFHEVPLLKLTNCSWHRWR